MKNNILPKDYGCRDGHIWVEMKRCTDAQCIKCGLASWNSLTYKESEKYTREEYKKMTGNDD